jgi:hypothetical protein
VEYGIDGEIEKVIKTEATWWFERLRPSLWQCGLARTLWGNRRIWILICTVHTTIAVSTLRFNVYSTQNVGACFLIFHNLPLQRLSARPLAKDEVFKLISSSPPNMCNFPSDNQTENCPYSLPIFSREASTPISLINLALSST